MITLHSSLTAKTWNQTSRDEIVFAQEMITVIWFRLNHMLAYENEPNAMGNDVEY